MPATVTDHLIDALARGPASAADLTVRLGVSQPTLSRALRPLEAAGRVVRFGSTRGARYGLAHSIGAIGSRWPLYRIDECGEPTELGTLHAIERDRYYVRGAPARLATLTEGLPYFLQDARPAGFLGRAIPTAHPELGLPARVNDWTDEHVIAYLVQRGADAVGDLILGREALDRHLSGVHGSPIVDEHAWAEAYPRLASAAMAGAAPGSSAHGEHPKFAVRIRRNGELVHALVKFSPPRDLAFGERWADLLISEAIASEHLATHGIPTAATRVLETGDRVFLESERFDRVGAHGRRGVATLLAVDTDLYGKLDRWARAAERLRANALLSPEDAARLALLDAFGDLVANTDRHFGNVTLFDAREGPFALAPAYDMLPMLFAPVDGQIVEREFVPEGVRADTLAVWPRARELALGYWARVAEDTRVTAAFRECARSCEAVVERTSLRGSAPIA